MRVRLDASVSKPFSPHDSRLGSFTEETHHWQLPMDSRYQRAVAMVSLPARQQQQQPAPAQQQQEQGFGEGGGNALTSHRGPSHLSSLHCLVDTPLTLHSFLPSPSSSSSASVAEGAATLVSLVRFQWLSHTQAHACTRALSSSSSSSRSRSSSNNSSSTRSTTTH